MGWFSRKVTVQFIDDATGEAFGRTELAPGDLPESFARETTLHIGDAEWSVVRAEPQTRRECEKSRSLTLRLRRIERIGPGEILFSLPSICDRLPGLGSGPLRGDECVLHEDDWRQFELVSRRLAAETDAEIRAIRRIHEQAWADPGWREIHVRSRPDPPIVEPLTPADVQRAFGEVVFRGITFRGAPSPIASGFSFTATDGLECYGIVENGRVAVLGIVDRPPAPNVSVDSLRGLAARFDLELVHWCRCQRVSPEDAEFGELVRGRSGT